MYRMCQNKTKEIVVNFMIMLQTVLMVYSWWVFFTYFNAGIFFYQIARYNVRWAESGWGVNFW